MEIYYFHPDVGDFFDELESVTRAKLSRLVEALTIEGYGLSMPYSNKKIGKNLYELRAQSVQNVRVFYTFHGGKIVLLHAMFKKSQKLAKRDLERARQRLTRLRL